MREGEPIRYRLAVLTHGRGSTLESALASFYAKVTPRPEEVIVYADGRFGNRSDFSVPGRSVQVRGGKGRGFCHATGALWRWATELPLVTAPYVFWLEHDFLFLEEIDLSPLAAILDADRTVAQVALMRNAASEREIAVGGLFESRPGDFQRELHVAVETRVGQNIETHAEGHRWLSHRSYFTTNPSLMRGDFMCANLWPNDDLPECEGRYGLDLLDRGYRFGVWGDGKPMVEHVGVRSGFGY